jgi:hypothetical protein
MTKGKWEMTVLSKEAQGSPKTDKITVVDDTLDKAKKQASKTQATKYKIAEGSCIVQKVTTLQEPLSVVTFDSNGGLSEPDPKKMSIVTGTKITNWPSSPLPKNGYVFDRWATNKEGSVNFNNPLVIKDMTLYAQYKKDPAAANLPWYAKAGNATYNAAAGVIVLGMKQIKKTDWDIMEKAITTSGKALGLMKDPPKFKAALDTVGSYLGTINTVKSVKDTTDSLKDLIDASKKYNAASTDAQKVDAIASISIYTLNTIDKALGIKGGAVSSFASAGKIFCTALIKGVANACKLIKERTYYAELVSDFGLEFGATDVINAAQKAGCCEIALRMFRSKKSDTEILKVIDAFQTIKNP